MKQTAWFIVVTAILGFVTAAGAEPSPTRARTAIDTVYVKSALSENGTAFDVGVGWDKSHWLWSSRPAGLTLSLDAEIGRWQTFHGQRSPKEDHFTHFGVTPMFRYSLSRAERMEWFVEGGVGPHFIVPLYRTESKRFSTSFNFQDLIGTGLRFGEDRQHELTLYIAHFSNGKIEVPNPGENYLQMRYLYNF